MKRLLTVMAAFALFATMALAQYQQQNPNPNVRSEENAQEKASHINDAVDIVNGPNVGNINGNSAWLTWQTNNEAATRVRYGTDPNNPSQHAYVAGGARDHRVQLTGLQPHTTYYYEIENRGGSDRFKGTFRTP